MGKLFAKATMEVSKREERNAKRARRIATQGMVLLKNDGTLPLKEAGRVALFGNGVRYTVKGGTGSGDVNSRFVVNVEKGLSDAGFAITTGAWLDRYDRAVAEAKRIFTQDVERRLEKDGMAGFWYVFNNPFHEPVIVPVTTEDVADGETDTAVYVLSRKSGEGKDRRPLAGEYELFDEEKGALKMLVKHYRKVIVVLNTGGVIDTKFLRSLKGINAILLMSQAGNIGGYALADVLLGKETPGGRLTATWAENYLDYPGAATFSHMNGDTDEEYYQEGIYVGYRYFDTFNVTPAYPFGYGLSYTDFAVNTNQVVLEKNQVKLSVTVKNTGDTHSGREVVQVYYSAPAGRLEKPYQELAAFAKTKELAPGETQNLQITFKVEHMASYDVETASWVLEKGLYYIRVGTDSRNTAIEAALQLTEDVVTEKLSNRLDGAKEMELLSAKSATAYTYAAEKEEMEKAPVITIHPDDLSYKEAAYRTANQEIPKTDKDFVITAEDVRAGRATLDELVSQLTVEEMATLCVGTARSDMGLGAVSVVGAASTTPGAAGDTHPVLQKTRDVRSMVLADGPAGLRLSKHFKADKDGNVIPGFMDTPMPGLELLMEKMPKAEIPADAVDYYQHCTALPIATLLAQTWDVETIEAVGDIVGEEMQEFGVTLWLAPGMNIQRNPLCGRNYEYYSEDPVLSGICAAVTTKGVQRYKGLGTTIKHFAFNNQEDNRMHTNANIGERAIREIYLKSFEIAIKESQPMSIMSSYNLINGIPTANSADLLTAIARDEWGFAGVVMTDWGTTGSLAVEGETSKYSYASPAGCVKAGNDLIMPGSQPDVDNIIASVGGAITLADLQACAKRIIKIIMQSAVYEDAVPYKG